MIRRRERLSYAAGDLGFNLVWQSIELYLLFFYIQILHLPLGIAAGIFLVGAAVDWLFDPLIGAVADRKAARYPMRLWVLLSGPLIAIALWLAFRSPPLAGMDLAIYAATTHIGLRFAYGCGNIPYAVLTARITDDPSEQLKLTGMRMQGAALGGLTAATIYALASGGDTPFLVGALILGVLAQPCFLITWLGVRERVASPPISSLPPVQEISHYFGLIGRDSGLRRLLVTIVVAGLSTTVTAKSILFLFDRDLQNPQWGYWAALLPSAALLITTPLWVALSSRIGLVTTLISAVLLHATALVMLTIFYGHGLAVATVILAIAISATCGMSVMFWSMVPIAIRNLETAPDGTGCAAHVYALSNVARKLGQALAPQIIALSLALTGGGDATLKGGAVLPGMILAAMICAITIMIYRPTSGGRNSAQAVSRP
ncbi:MFS transporter [uncultured Parasphingorhabdus sp.]|uniref:MFS transporter n=1 Tax=uncultured Parasphingorhabdus sp. TaxID=2709694 RepID=UPI0030DBB390